uniref:Uncharacterized protein n=1 Tax=Oryza barthii TaxID=65489 RepID=A0A0D3F7Q6_9ORYZ
MAIARARYVNRRAVEFTHFPRLRTSYLNQEHGNVAVVIGGPRNRNAREVGVPASICGGSTTERSGEGGRGSSTASREPHGKRGTCRCRQWRTAARPEALNRAENDALRLSESLPCEKPLPHGARGDAAMQDERGARGMAAGSGGVQAAVRRACGHNRPFAEG